MTSLSVARNKRTNVIPNRFSGENLLFVLAHNHFCTKASTFAATPVTAGARMPSRGHLPRDKTVNIAAALFPVQNSVKPPAALDFP